MPTRCEIKNFVLFFILDSGSVYTCNNKRQDKTQFTEFSVHSTIVGHVFFTDSLLAVNKTKFSVDSATVVSNLF